MKKPNGGVSSARNAGLKEVFARADITHVTFLDADDAYHPQCIECVRAAAAEFPDAAIEWEFATDPSEAFFSSRYERAAPLPVERGAGCNVWSVAYPVAAVRDISFCEKTDIAEDIAYNYEVSHRTGIRFVHLPLALYGYYRVDSSAMHRPLHPSDFTRRAAVLEQLIAVASDDRKALDVLTRDEIPQLLKQFVRSLRRVAPREREEARRILGEEIRALRRRGLLHPKSGALKNLRHYWKFLWIGRFAK